MEEQSEDLAWRRAGDVTVVRVRGENMTATLDVARVGAEIEAMVDGGARKIVLDLGAVHYAASAFLGMLMGVLKKIKSAKGRLVLANVAAIEPLFRISRTEKLFEMAKDVDAAVARLGK